MHNTKQYFPSLTEEEEEEEEATRKPFILPVFPAEFPPNSSHPTQQPR